MSADFFKKCFFFRTNVELFLKAVTVSKLLIYTRAELTHVDVPSARPLWIMKEERGLFKTDDATD